MKNIINKFVGMNAETRARTIAAFIVAVADVLSVFNIIEFSDSQLNAIKNLVLMLVTGFVWAYCSHFKNNDYTKGAVQGTGVARQINREQKPGYIGERFYTNNDGTLLTENNTNFITEEVSEDTMAVEELEAESEINEEKDS